jgi:hypothetical protein
MAMACICSLDKGLSKRQTAAGLPENGLSVKESKTAMANFLIHIFVEVPENDA